MTRLFHSSYLVISAAALTACIGGGGNGTSATLASISSWIAVQPGSSIDINGISQSGLYKWNSTTDQVTEATLDPSTPGASYTATYNSSGQATALTIKPAGGTAISFNNNIDIFGQLIINSSIDAVFSADGTKYALAANPFDYGWDYQSFGIWTTGAGTGSGTYGALSAGAETAGGAIPTTGTASYNGFTGGRYVNAEGQSWFTSSAMAAAANFGTRSIAFHTTGSQVTPNLLSVASNANLDMTGTLTYAAGTNQITGNVSTTGGLTGTVNGRFYGPAAQEIGGTFAVSGAGIEGYAGAFGGKR